MKSKLVPVEPTEAMMLNGSGCKHHAFDDMGCIQRQMRKRIWDKMIAAAPMNAYDEAAERVAYAEHLKTWTYPVEISAREFGWIVWSSCAKAKAGVQ